MMNSYMDHCWTALMNYGKYVFTTLKTERHFYDFVGDEKAQEHGEFRLSWFLSNQLSVAPQTLQEGPHRYVVV